MAKITGYVSVCDFLNDPTGASEDKLRDAIANVGPIYVSMYASDEFTKYKAGILNIHSDSTYTSQASNHAVLAIGYGTDATTGQDYFTIMNVNFILRYSKKSS